MRNFALFGGGDGEFSRLVVLETLAKGGKHFAGRFAGGADDEDVAKPLFVSTIEGCEGIGCFRGGGVNAGLFVAGPLTRLCGDGFGRLLFADPRMTTKRFEPIVTIE